DEVEEQLDEGDLAVLRRAADPQKSRVCARHGCNNPVVAQASARPQPIRRRTTRDALLRPCSRLSSGNLRGAQLEPGGDGSGPRWAGGYVDEEDVRLQGRSMLPGAAVGEDEAHGAGLARRDEPRVDDRGADQGPSTLARGRRGAEIVNGYQLEARAGCRLDLPLVSCRRIATRAISNGA